MSDLLTLDTVGRHSMDSPEWYTPLPFIEAAREVMGGIDLDPASHEEANRNVKATRYLTEQDNGLTCQWHGRIFLNPPGGFVNEFWFRLLHEFQAAHVSEAVWIGYSLEQLQTIQAKAGSRLTPLHFPTMFTAKRIAFIENEAKKALRIQKLLAAGEATNAKPAARKLAASIRSGKEPPNSPSHSNYVTYIGPHVEWFARAFEKFGIVKL